LVIVGCIGIGDENRCEAELRKLAQAGGASARNHEVRRGIGFFHTMMERSDILWDAFALVIGGRETVVVLPVR
jgi:hypothetical protein